MDSQVTPDATTTGQTDTAPAGSSAVDTQATAVAAAPTAETPPVTETKTEDAPQGAPEAYEFAAPEGVELDKDLVGKFTPLAKELNLTQAQAQKLVDFQREATEHYAAQAQAEVQGWVEAVKADKEIGGDKLPENLALASKAFTTFGTPALQKLLDERGLGNHPELVRWAVRVGKSISEDAFVPSGKTAGPSSAAKGFYDKSPQLQ